jgi:hypothetical protein
MFAAVAVLGIQSTFAQNRVKNISAESAKLDVAQVENVGQTVKLSRYLYAGYNTLCLPMSMSAEKLQEAVPGAKIERLVAIGQVGSTLNLYFVDCTAEGIDAGMPYLIFSPTTMRMSVKNTDATQFSTTANVVRMTDGQGNQVSFSSGWEVRQRDGMYGIPAKQNVQILESVLIRTTADQGFYPTRCGFNWESQSATARTLEVKHVRDLAEVSGLQTLTADDAAIVDVYDLNGIVLLKQVKLAEAKTLLPAGVYIIGGEKVTFK